jgi:hypothetical protein
MYAYSIMVRPGNVRYYNGRWHVYGAWDVMMQRIRKVVDTSTLTSKRENLSW